MAEHKRSTFARTYISYFKRFSLCAGSIRRNVVVKNVSNGEKIVLSGFLSFERKYDDAMLPLGLTYSAHPVACAAAVETLKIYEDDSLIENAAEMGRYLAKQVELLKPQHTSIGDYRNTGLLGCIELVKNRATKEPMAPFNAKPDEMLVMNKVAAKIKELGMFTFVRWSYIFIAPPLCVTREQINEGLAIINAAITIADCYTK